MAERGGGMEQQQQLEGLYRLVGSGRGGRILKKRVNAGDRDTQHGSTGSFLRHLESTPLGATGVGMSTGRLERD